MIECGPNALLNPEENYYYICRLKAQKCGHQSLISFFFLKCGVSSILINGFTK